MSFSSSNSIYYNPCTVGFSFCRRNSTYQNSSVIHSRCRLVNRALLHMAELLLLSRSFGEAVDDTVLSHHANYVCSVAYNQIVAGTCGTILVKSIRDQTNLTQSAQFLANQRRITIGIIHYMILEIFGVGLPITCVIFCTCFSVGNILVSHYSVISVSTYPIFSPYYVLMTNTDYRKKIEAMMKRAWKTLNFHNAHVVVITI
ncbi:unnamed protein product [Auanema sp. JU1783]|nr:unnamed protein product [Auanema sp. JU1783]